MTAYSSICFGPYRLDGPEGQLWRRTEMVHLTPKALAVLWELVSQAGQVVSKAALFERVWADTAVGDAVSVSHLLHMVF